MSTGVETSAELFEVNGSSYRYLEAAFDCKKVWQPFSVSLGLY